MPMRIEEIITPAVVIDRERLVDNIASMAEFAANNNVALRPHVKTHKCPEIARMQQHHGCKGITVATLGEGYAFAEAGFDDITLAKPFVQGKEKEAIRLANKVSLNLLVDHPHTVRMLQQAAAEECSSLKIMLKVDCGYHRCGIDPERPESVRLAQNIDDSPNLDFVGILTHAGHSYAASSNREMREIAEEEQEVMIQFSKKLREADGNLNPSTVSIGSTPTMTHCEKIKEGITEIRPGNYVFYDYTQAVLGSCGIKNIALSVVASVVGVYEGRVVIDAGATTLSKDQGPVHVEPDGGYGRIIEDYDSNTLDNSCTIRSLSQEHGKITIKNKSMLHGVEPGTKVRIFPNHSCLVANLFNQYHVLENDEITTTWDIRRQRLNDRSYHVRKE